MRNRIGKNRGGAIVAGATVLALAGCSDGGAAADSAPRASRTPSSSPASAAASASPVESRAPKVVLKGTWMPYTLPGRTAFYVLTVDAKGDLVSIGSPAGRDGDICDGSLTGRPTDTLKLVLDCLDTHDIKVGPAPKKRVYRAEVVAATAEQVMLPPSRGTVLVARWSDGRIDYLTH
jgi:hypothetical protein